MSIHFDVVVLGAGPGGYVAAIRAAQLGSAPRSSRRGTGAASASTWAASPPRRCCATPSSPTSSRSEAKTFGIQVDGEVTLRLRRGLQAQPQGRRRPRQGRPLPDEEEQHHRVRRPRHVHRPAHAPGGLTDGGTETVTFDHCIIATGATTKLLPGTSLSRAGGDVRGADPQRGAAGEHRDRRRRRDRRRVRLRAAQLRREGDDRRVPRPDRPAGGRGGLRRAGQAVPAARHRRADLHPRRVDRRLRRQGPRDGHQRRRSSRSSRPTRCCRRSASAPRRRLRPGEHRRARSPSAAPSTSTAAAARTCRTSTPSATSPRS